MNQEANIATNNEADNAKVINKIKGLFNLANDNSNEHQAEAAMAKAYELLARHKLDKSDVMGFVKPNDAYIKEKGFEYDSRVPTEWHYIHGILSEFFNINTMRGHAREEYTGTHSKNGKARVKGVEGFIWFIGKQEDIEIAKIIYNQLYFQYKYLWEKYRQRTGASTTDKRNYYQGLMIGLMRRLREQKANIETELSLVIVKDPKIQQATNEFFPETRTTAAAKYEPNSHIRNAGIDDSNNIQINKSVGAGGSYGKAIHQLNA